MMNRRFAILILIVGLGGVTVLHNACGVLKGMGGTGTGNPMGLEGEPYPPANQPSPAGHNSSVFVVRLIQEICSSVLRCHAEADSMTCLNVIMADAELPVFLGLDSNLYSTAMEIIPAEQTQLLHVIESHGADCLSDIKQIMCNSGAMQSAFESGSYGLAARLTLSSPSCARVYASGAGDSN